MNPILSVKNLTKIFTTKSWFSAKTNTFTALDGISFDLAHGEILGFLGPNGAGKTTTIQLLLGAMRPTSGSITYFGKDFVHNRSEIAQQINFASAYSQLPTKLTIAENLDIFGQLYSIPSRERHNRIEKLLKFFGMWNLKDKYTGALSAGQITRVMLSKAFLNDPQVVLLDEPTASLDPDITQEVRHFILEQQRARNISILFTSHNMADVSEICDRVLILKQGKIIADSTPEQLAASVSQTKVELMVGPDLEKAKNFAAAHKLTFNIKEHHTIEITLDEHQIAHLLAGLATIGVLYTQISIQKPTLEDYFVHVARSSKGM